MWFEVFADYGEQKKKVSNGCSLKGARYKTTKRWYHDACTTLTPRMGTRNGEGCANGTDCGFEAAEVQQPGCPLLASLGPCNQQRGCCCSNQLAPMELDLMFVHCAHSVIGIKR